MSWLLVLPLNSHTHSDKAEVSFPSHILLSSLGMSSSPFVTFMVLEQPLCRSSVVLGSTDLDSRWALASGKLRGRNALPRAAWDAVDFFWHPGTLTAQRFLCHAAVQAAQTQLCAGYSSAMSFPLLKFKFHTYMPPQHIWQECLLLVTEGFSRFVRLLPPSAVETAKMSQTILNWPLDKSESKLNDAEMSPCTVRSALFTRYVNKNPQIWKLLVMETK